MSQQNKVTNPTAVDQLVLVAGFESQAHSLMTNLTNAGFYVTQIDARGGLMYEARISLLIGLNRERLPELLAHIRTDCSTEMNFVPAYGETLAMEAQPMILEAEMGGASIYVLDVEFFEQF